MSDLRRIGMTMLPPRPPRPRQVSCAVQETLDSSDERPAGAGSKTLWVGNLRSDIDGPQLRSEFEGFGTLINARIVSNQSRYALTFGFVQFATFVEATRAREAKDGALVKGFYIKVQYAKNGSFNVYRPTKKTLQNGKAKDEAASNIVLKTQLHRPTELFYSSKRVENIPDAESPPTHKKLRAINIKEKAPLTADAPRLVQRHHRHRVQINTKTSGTSELKDVRYEKSQDCDERKREDDSLQAFTTSETACLPGASSKHTPRFQSSSTHILEGLLSMPRKRKHSDEAGEPRSHELSQQQKPSLETHAALSSNITPPRRKQSRNAENLGSETRLPSSRPFAVSLPGIDFSESVQKSGGEADMGGPKKKLKRRRLHPNIFSFGMHSDSDSMSDISLAPEESSCEGPTGNPFVAPKINVNESDEEVEVIDLTTPPGSVKAEPED